MRHKKFWFILGTTLAVMAVALVLVPGAGAASTFKILYKFKGRADGGTPFADLIFDAAGNLYGTTYDGTVFKLTPNADGSWTKRVLHYLNSPSWQLADGSGGLERLTTSECLHFPVGDLAFFKASQPTERTATCALVQLTEVGDCHSVAGSVAHGSSGNSFCCLSGRRT